MKTLLTILATLLVTTLFSQTSYIKYYKTGQLKETGNFADSMYMGCVTRYYINGQIEFEGQYTGEGKEDGLIKYYYPNGQVQFEYFAVSGKISGKAVRYSSEGKISKIEHYINGVLVGTDLAKI